MAGSFLNVFKHKRIRNRSYLTREEAKQDVFNYMETLHIVEMQLSEECILSSIEFERQRAMKSEETYKAWIYLNKALKRYDIGS